MFMNQIYDTGTTVMAWDNSTDPKCAVLAVVVNYSHDSNSHYCKTIHDTGRDCFLLPYDVVMPVEEFVQTYFF